MEVGDNGYEQQRPEVSIANKAQTEMRAWAKEFRINASSAAENEGRERTRRRRHQRGAGRNDST